MSFPSEAGPDGAQWRDRRFLLNSQHHGGVWTHVPAYDLERRAGKMTSAVTMMYSVATDVRLRLLRRNDPQQVGPNNLAHHVI